jgi:hypothetical protein
MRARGVIQPVSAQKMPAGSTVIKQGKCSIKGATAGWFYKAGVQPTRL